ncbi:dihydroorotase [Chloroflexota bacterium]
MLLEPGLRLRAALPLFAVCPTPPPPLDNKATIDYVKLTAAAEGVIRVLPIGCISKDRKGEELAPLDEMASAGVVGYSDDGNPVLNSEVMFQALEFSRSHDLPIIDHCEDTTFTIGGLINDGTSSTRLNLSSISAAAEWLMVMRDLALARLTGGRLHIAHVSTRGSIEFIQQGKEEGIRVTAEVTPHHLTLTEEKVIDSDINAKVNPPLRAEKDIHALTQGLKDGVIDIIATDHAPHTEADKRVDFALAPPGISGFETALGILMSLVHNGQLTLNTLIAKLTCEPAGIIGGRHGKLGTLAIGAPADITIFDPERDWVVDTGSFASKGRNTPLTGSTLKGKVMATIFQGKLVYKDNLIKVEERI